MTLTLYFKSGMSFSVPVINWEAKHDHNGLASLKWTSHSNVRLVWADTSEIVAIVEQKS
jgi:hypothetical protein